MQNDDTATHPTVRPTARPTARPAATRSLDPQKRRAILEAAQAVFLRAGFRDASMDDDAREAGVGKMTVYRHFGSKEALFETMLAEVCAGTFPGRPVPKDADLHTELVALAHAFLDLVTDPKRMATYRLAMAEGERFPDLGRLFHSGAVMVVLNHVAARLRAHAPGLGEDDSKRIGGMFLQMVQGPAMLRLLLGVPPEPWNADFGPQVDMAVEFAEARLRAAGQIRDAGTGARGILPRCVIRGQAVRVPCGGRAAPLTAPGRGCAFPRAPSGARR